METLQLQHWSQDVEEMASKLKYREFIWNLHVAVQLDIGALEHEPLQGLRQSQQHRKDLLSYDRQHLDIDAVELVEAAPAAALSYTWRR
ncbi:unnamed protein product [Leptidea sinapis]|uniref:Uncharacterized protein n=1 Tax=Leptidea sinapis TaxID=189913 RepID=A0A5E4QTJ0_9NEOP|nr:unnamed protein product [Leptidea sinapis]